MRRTILSALAVVIALGFAANASANENNLSLANTAWMTSYYSDGVKQASGMIFKDNGDLLILVVRGQEEQEIKAQYYVQGNVIVVTVNGQRMEMDIVALDDNQLVTDGGAKGRLTWQRFRK